MTPAIRLLLPANKPAATCKQSAATCEQAGQVGGSRQDEDDESQEVATWSRSSGQMVNIGYETIWVADRAEWE